MASEGNEYRDRQRQRAEARRKRELARKRMMLRLGLAAAVIVACGLFIWLVTAGSGNSAGTASTQPGSPEVTTRAPEDTAQSVKEDRTTISVAVAGDLIVNAATVAA